jgi:hypothetical protein
MRLSKLFLATLGATVLLGALVGSASARRIESSSQTLRSLFREVIFNGIFGNIQCEVQLEGSLHSRTIEKIRCSLIGYITAARILACARNAATILTETLPWHVQYESFTGTLPTITSIKTNVIGAAFRIREPFETCLARSTATNPSVGTYTIVSGTITSAEISGTGIPTVCPGFTSEGEFRSNAAPVTVLNSTTRITVRLI